MKNEIYGVIAFNSTHHAIKGEKLLKNVENIITIPTPREITASCGLALKFPLENIAIIVKTIAKEDLDIMGIYKIKREGFNKTAEKISIKEENIDYE
ncbi:DUF3343 domain-containing protein [Abyssisolibacter fermentans]|uniref:DUF3343 domain-containing protein n=1 Tax=Abyssisolibacter fermentans TaxID=1766203 RepID=UPI0008375F76|nr:DUF3343 domain-containing protein [Abyssisolibacter fermentans]